MHTKVNIKSLASLMLLAAVAFVSCTKEGDTILVPDPDDAADSSPLVTVLYDPDALGDRAYNDLIYQGVEDAATKHHLRTLQLSPTTREEGAAYLETFFTQMAEQRDTIRRLFIVTTPAYDEWLRKNNRRLESNPYVDLLYLENQTPLEGKGSTLYISYYGAMYQAGALAPHFSSQALVVGANPKHESVASAIQGFSDGFASDIFPTEEEKHIDIAYLGSAIDEGFGIADTTALKFLEAHRYNEGLYALMVPVCGGSATTLHRMNDVLMYNLMMGIDAPIVSVLSPYSAVKHIDQAVGRCIDQWLSAEGMPKHQSLGLKDGFTGVEFHIVQSIMSWAFEGELTEDIIKKAHDEAVRKEEEYEK